MIDAISGGSAAISGTAAGDGRDAGKIKDAARQFESLLLANMLKSMRDSEGGWMGTGEDQSSSSAMEYAQEMFAQSLSANGGLGLASMVVKGLEAGTKTPAE